MTDIKTKFSPGDKVFKIQNKPQQVEVKCRFCGGTGTILGLNGTNGECPECRGRGGKSKWLPTKWLVDSELTLGQVKVEITDSPGINGGCIEQDAPDLAFDNYKPQQSQHEKYMAVETGIGSGSVWEAENLFTTRQEAEAECEKRNVEDRVLAED